jgi:hypothetical protein
MKISAIKLGTFIIFLVVIATGCSKKPSQPTEIAALIDIDYQAGPEISRGGIVEAWMENMSDQCISFPLDFNTKIFIEQNEDWTEVPNRVTYIGDRPVLLKPKGDIRSSALVYIRPDTSGLTITESVDSYALVTGNLCDDENFVIEKKIDFVIIP